MKVICSVCESMEAKVICCADEAVLCQVCDEKIHAANNLAMKHQRIPLFALSSPKCDIYQLGTSSVQMTELLLCQNCDASIHSVNNLTSAHQRFLLPGVRVGCHQSAELSPSATSFGKSDLVTKSIKVAKSSQPIFIRVITPNLVFKDHSAQTGNYLEPVAKVPESSCIVPDYDYRGPSPSAHSGLHRPSSLYDGESSVPEILISSFFKNNNNQSQPSGHFNVKRRKK